MIVIADASKRVDTLGRFPLPIEVNSFGLAATRLAIGKAAVAHGLPADRIVQRMTPAGPFVTDGGHFILDASFGRIPDSRALSGSLHAVPGVVEHGLFIGLADLAIIAGPDGASTLTAPGARPGSRPEEELYGS
jgi:ribose 5-phosphate isomerase A